MVDIATLARFEQYEVEQLFVSTAIQYPLFTLKVAGWLPPRIILGGAARKFWEVLKNSATAGMSDEQADCAVSKAVLASGVEKATNGNYQEVAVIDMMPQALAGEIARRHYVSAVGSRLGKLSEAVKSSDDAEIRRMIAEMHAAMPVDTDNSLSTQDLFEMTAKAVTTGERSIETFIPNLDKSIGGLERQTETIVAGRPSMGKSGLMWQIARNVAPKGYKVMFYSLEMSAISLWARAVAPQTGMLWRDIRSGNASPAQLDIFTRKSAELKDKYGANLRVVDGSHTTDSIWRGCAVTMPDVVFVDHLRYVKDRGENENKRQGLISEKLRDMAKALNCAVVIAAQLNRGVEDRQDKTPMLSDLRDTGELEENADVVLMIYRPDYYDPPVIPTNRHYTEIWVRKNRDGIQNSLVKLTYDTGLQWFEPIDERRMGPMV